MKSNQYCILFLLSAIFLFGTGFNANYPSGIEEVLLMFLLFLASSGIIVDRVQGPHNGNRSR